MAERQVSLEGLPEPVARAIEVVVQMARRLAATENRHPDNGPIHELPKWEGRVIGQLSRSEIYDDV